MAPQSFGSRVRKGRLVAGAEDVPGSWELGLRELAGAVPDLRSMRYDRWTPSLGRLGEVYEWIGEPDSARAPYADFLLAWEEADDDRPRSHAAREALGRLMREATL